VRWESGRMAAANIRERLFGNDNGDDMNESNGQRRADVAGVGTKVGAMRQGLIGVGVGLGLALGATGCHKAQPTLNAAVDQNGADPANANMASGNGTDSSYGTAQQSTQQSTQRPARVLGARAQNESQQQGEDYSPQQGADLYNADLTEEQADNPPPPLPEYEQPPAPDPDYLWTPGYWAWGPGGYYWVPGCWVAAPYEGALWTPGYWGFYREHYRFHHGYWGRHIGYYGGVDYGYGYVGHGYYGGYWNHDHFFYNTTINRVNVNVIHNVYVHPVVINNVSITGRIGNRVSFNGGRDGVQARPLVAEARVMQEQRIAPMATQVQAQHAAAQNRQQFFNQNGGRPAVAVASRPIAADRVLPAALPRSTGPVEQRSVGNAGPAQIQARPGQAQPQTRQVQPQSETRQAQPQSQGRSAQTQPQTRAGQSQVQPQARTSQPQSQTRQAQSQQGQTQQSVRQTQERSAQPQSRPVQAQSQTRSAQPSEQTHAAPVERSAPQPQSRPAPQAQARPQASPQPAAATHPQAQAAPARPAPAAHPQPQPQARPKEEERH